MGRACCTHGRRRRRKEECIQGFVGKFEGNRPLGRPKHKWQDNIKMDIRRLEWGELCTGFVWLRIGPID
jgi:hypothetical protein